MPFQLSPGVAVVEKDFTSIVPAVATSGGAFAGVFQWGPVLDPVRISSENELVTRFGKPVDANASSFFTAANFLSYTNNLLVARADSNNAKNAVANSVGSLLSATVTNPGTGFTDIPVVTVSAGTGTATATLKAVTVAIGNAAGTGYAVNNTFTVNIGSGTEATFRVTSVNSGVVTGLEIVNAGNYSDIVAGSLTNVATINLVGTGSGLTINIALGLNTVSVSGGNYATAPTLTANGSNGGSGSAISNVTIAPVGIKIKNVEDYITNFANEQASVGTWAAKFPGSLGNSLKVVMVDANTFDETVTIGGNTINIAAQFDGAPSVSDYAASKGAQNDEVHVIIFDEDGEWTGTRGGVLEKFAFLSKASDAKKSDGANNYYKEVINSQSRYIWVMDHPTDVTGSTSWGTPAVAGANFKSLSVIQDNSLTGGVDDFASTSGQVETAWLLFADDSQYDISLLPLGNVSAATASKVIADVAEKRLDCVVFVSPRDTASGDVIIGSGDDATSKAKAFRDALPSTSYAVLDSGFKYQYDRYNDKYRWIPLNGDIAGLCARTDFTNDPWFSPGGLNRGQVKNVVKLAFNPNKADRDELYKNGINPVVTFPGQGTVLFGDKTLLKKPSAFDRINVRRLFIVLEKAIATAAKFQLFEFNDGFTRAQFKNLVEPFLRDVQGRRGITDFRVKCDETNNTGEVIDRNEFIADIFIKPARSINFITLNFVAARTSINFNEIGA